MTHHCSGFRRFFKLFTGVLCTAVILALSASVSVAQNWPEIYDPLQLLTLNLEMSNADWLTIQQDETLSIEVPAWFWTGDEAPILVAVRRKSADPLNEASGFTKVGLKIDINELVVGQSWHDLKKLSLENGDDQDVVSEGLSWQLHHLAAGPLGYGYDAGHACWVVVVINGVNTGVYVHAEQRDKRYLENRGLYVSGQTWLYKMSDIGQYELKVGTGDSPTYAALCYSPFHSNGCPLPAPAQLVSELDGLINMQAMLTMGAINAFVGNRDALFSHGKNVYFADFIDGAPRMYFPWDQDSSINGNAGSIYPTGSQYADVILGLPEFHDQFTEIVANLFSGPLSAPPVIAFLNAVEPVLSAALAADPNNQIGSDVAGHFDSLRSWVVNRIDEVGQEVDLTSTGVPAAAHGMILGQNRPNPFNPATVITFRLEKPLPVSLRVYDVSGRLVRELLPETGMSAGEHTIRWDGRYTSGMTAAAGVYFYQLETGNSTQTRYMTLVK